MKSSFWCSSRPGHFRPPATDPALPRRNVLGRQPRLALDLVGDDRHYELSTTQDKAWKRAYEIREAARKALLEMDCKERLQRASRARPRRALEDHVFTEGQPVTVWRQGCRGALAKVGPCYVILQNGLTVWVTRRGELWKCNASQIFPIGPLQAQGLEVIPRDLLMTKERLRFDNEKLGYVDVTQENAESREPEGSHLDGQGQASQKPEAATRACEQPETGPPNLEPEDDLPSDLDSYAPWAEPHEQQAPLEDRPRPAEPHEPRASVENQVEPRMSPGLASGPPPTTPAAGRGQWPQATAVRVWKRYDNNASRFRVSNSTGPMWSDVFRRQTLDLDKNEVIADETFTGDERPRRLSRALPEGVKNIETTVFYRPRPGHPGPGVAVGEDFERGLDTEEDKRLFDRGLKRGHDGQGARGQPQPKSRVGGVWVADCVTAWGDKRQFGKLERGDTFYTYSELHSGWICLTKKSGKELQERTLTQQEKQMFDEAKLTEIGNLEGSNAIRFVTDPAEIERIRSSFSHRIMPSRFILTKKQQEVGQAWKAKARWILLGHKDPDAQELERYAPTPATPTVYLAFQILSSMRHKLVIMDVSSAFGQSDQREREKGPLFATMPPTGVPGKERDHLIQILTAVYGLVNAPAVWRKTVRRVLDQLGYIESTFDPCLYYLPFLAAENPHRQRGCAGLVLLDVDDFVQGGNSHHGELMEILRKQFRFGKWRVIFGSSGEYLGRTVSQDENFEIRITMQRYIKEKLRNITLTREKIKDEGRVLDANEVTLVRGAGGSLLWIGRECRPDMGAACAMSMSWAKDGPTVRNIKQINRRSRNSITRVKFSSVSSR